MEIIQYLRGNVEIIMIVTIQYQCLMVIERQELVRFVIH